MSFVTSCQTRRLLIELTEAARALLAKDGFDPLFGARPMARVIQSKIKEPLASEMLFGVLQSGGRVVIDVQDSALHLAYHAAEPVA